MVEAPAAGMPQPAVSAPPDLPDLPELPDLPAPSRRSVRRHAWLVSAGGWLLAAVGAMAGGTAGPWAVGAGAGLMAVSLLIHAAGRSIDLRTIAMAAMRLGGGR
ncbi:MAG: hypothetical protein RLO50_06415 [Azospirillaceae bacterium]